ncbi:MAG: hypothetical protein COB20_02705 [SAR86 cluster bacterium]|uniref:Histidine kinase/HSP90-like ATPase domain-containing protein n=1 Tax=SAR86 cluster bacterium TaxID=2030880 RepID=A0A2A4XDT5_9GAMM|nr:MAG: hypothetical protein COB20_02705 [SAR86 cluster bacterium]
MRVQLKTNELRFHIASEFDVKLAVLQAGKFASAIDSNETVVQKIMTTVSELAQNIVKYAGVGHIHVRKICRSDIVVIEIIAEDTGPGIRNIELAMGDNFSSGGTLGLGLPGVKRLMDEFHIESNAKDGTSVTAVKWIHDK